MAPPQVKRRCTLVCGQCARTIPGKRGVAALLEGIAAAPYIAEPKTPETPGMLRADLEVLIANLRGFCSPFCERAHSRR